MDLDFWPAFLNRTASKRTTNWYSKNEKAQIVDHKQYSTFSTYAILCIPLCPENFGIQWEYWMKLCKNCCHTKSYGCTTEFYFKNLFTFLFWSFFLFYSVLIKHIKLILKSADSKQIEGIIFQCHIELHFCAFLLDWDSWCIKCSLFCFWRH